MKVLVFAGSPRPEKSVSLEAARRLLGRFAEITGEEPETEIITEKNAGIDSCRGCMSCFAAVSVLWKPVTVWLSLKRKC